MEKSCQMRCYQCHMMKSYYLFLFSALYGVVKTQRTSEVAHHLRSPMNVYKKSIILYKLIDLYKCSSKSRSS